MTTEEIIQQIISNKNRPHLNFSLKHKTEKFTDNLFHTLFDAKACVSKNIEQLEIDFKEVYKLACLVQDGSCKEIWRNTRRASKQPGIKICDEKGIITNQNEGVLFRIILLFYWKKRSMRIKIILWHHTPSRRPL